MDAYIPSGDELRAARERIKPHIILTPLLRAEGLERPGRRVFLKPENLQRTGSFKVRGAFNALASLSLEVRPRGVVAFSSGNHGAAVALAARELGQADRGSPYPCTVVVPERASAPKIAAILELGAEVVHCGSTVDERQAKATELADARGAALIPSYDDIRIICGQGSLGGEIMDQWMGQPSKTRRLHMVVGPVGGGGLMAGTSAHLRARGFSSRIVGVEPEEANDTQRSFASGVSETIPVPMTICDGLRSIHPGKITFPILKKCLESVVTVSDEAVVAAMRFLLKEMKLLCEPSGAVAVAAWMTGALEPISDQGGENPGDVILIVSGGNVDLKTVLTWASRT